MVEVDDTPQKRPFNPLFYQRWSDLLFVHWRFPAEVLESRLPDGLALETFGGHAWVGVVPFVLSRARPACFFPIPFFDTLLELNLRTYVRDPEGRSGVWFFSLETNRALAAWGGRQFYHLNYQRARFRLDRRSDEEIAMEVQRRKPEAPVVNIHYTRQLTDGRRAKPGSLEEFLVERYRLFSLRKRDRALCTCEISHAPYRLLPANVRLDGRELFGVNGLPVPDEPPAHAVAAMPVDVATDRLRSLEAGVDALAQSSAMAAS